MQPIPIFLFSMPRSGSTLLQRILASHTDIATTSEPWILLPFLYALRQTGVFAEYGHRQLTTAVQDFSRAFPEGIDDYLAEIHDTVVNLYSKAVADRAKYFIDKTPRYHLVIDDVIRMFPEAKLIFLWRNPLAVIASMIDTWAAGRWKTDAYSADLFRGLPNLVSAYKKHAHRALAIRYEDLVRNPERESKRAFLYLDLPFDSSVLNKFPDVTLWHADEPRHVRTRPCITEEAVEKWKLTLSSPIRKFWCRRYLSWLGKESLEVMGFDFSKLIDDLDQLPSRPYRLVSDSSEIIRGVLYSAVKARVLDEKGELLPWHLLYRRGNCC